MFTVARLDTVRIVVAVPEADAALVQEKAKVKLSIKAAQPSPFEGTVSRISWALDSSARTLRAEIDLPNKEGNLRPGMYVHAQIFNDCPNSWTLPVSAVIKQGDAFVCFLVEGGKAMRTPVQVGRSDAQNVEVLKRQKSASPPLWTEFTGDEVVVARALGVTDGQLITIELQAK